MTKVKVFRLFTIISILIIVIASGWTFKATASSLTAQSRSQVDIFPDQAGLNIQLNLTNQHSSKAILDGVSYDILSFDGQNGSIQQPGFPEIPVLDLIVGIPVEGEAFLKIVSLDSEQLPGTYRLPPAPVPAPLEKEFTPGKMVRTENNTLDSAIAVFPETTAVIAGEAWIRGQRVVRVQISPFQYNPSSKTATFHPEINLRIDFTAPDSAPDCLNCTYDQEFESVLQQQIINYDQSRNWRAASASETLVHQIVSPLTNTFLGPRYEIVIDEDGIYHLNYDELQAAGMDVAAVDPRTFKLFNHGTELDILVVGEEDGSFDEGDYVAFYGEKFHGDIMEARYQDTMTQGIHESGDPAYAANNWFWQCRESCELASYFERYTDDNVYYLTTGGGNGLRMASQSGTPSGAPIPDHFITTLRAEESNAWYPNEFFDDDIWFWENNDWKGTFPVTSTYPSQLNGLATGPFTATIYLEFAIYRDDVSKIGDYHTQFAINGNIFSDQTWDSSKRYTVSADIPQSQLLEGENSLQLTMLQTFYLSQRLYFDFYEVTYARDFSSLNDQLAFNHEAGNWRYQITRLISDTVEVYDITDPMKPIAISDILVTGSAANYTAAFETTTNSEANYIVAGSDSGILTPKRLAAYEPPNFATMPEADYLLITHANFLTSTQTLANYRESKGHSVAVIDVNDLYHEFNDGIYHPIAIKNFIAYAFANWSTPPVYVTLVGNGNWNMKNVGDGTNKYYHNAPPTYMPPNLAYIDPWQGEVDSANLLATVIGDDTMPDVHIARIPVNTDAQMAGYVDKVLNYESAGLQDWQKNILFIADNIPDPGYAGNFVGLSEAIISDYVNPTFPYQPLRIYEDTGIYSSTIYTGIPDYDCTIASSPECDAATYAITSTLNITGALLVNYTGHASLDRWSGESVFLNEDIATLDNAGQLPVILSMTCLDGHWTYPNIESLAYRFITDEGRGAIATYSPTGLGVASGHDYIQRGFYTSMFEDDNWELGAAATAGKMALWSTGFNYDLMHTFILFGDPALHLNNVESIFFPAITNE